jgi:hypothetical protein
MAPLPENNENISSPLVVVISLTTSEAEVDGIQGNIKTRRF